MNCRVSQPAAFDLLCIAGHLPSPLVPTAGHLTAYKCHRPREFAIHKKKKKANSRRSAREGGGGGRQGAAGID